MKDLDYFLIFNLQEGFSGVAMLEVQRRLNKNEKNFEKSRRKYKKSDTIRCFEDFKDCLKKEYIILIYFTKAKIIGCYFGESVMVS